ncbi:MAG: tripartite tricarboxylate transporter TctB family protein [Betaproteobacteria bacterium]|nr:tripartite tricarboxylate transporter TctB family protein [Betaproteobacteria bacterium]
MSIKSQKDFFSGLMFLVVGAAFAWGATSYSVGTGARMGPGYFPLLLGVLLAILGGVVMFYSLVVETPKGDKVGSIQVIQNQVQGHSKTRRLASQRILAHKTDSSGSKR